MNQLSATRVVQPPTARGLATRSRLLAAALEAFATQGFHGTGTRDIAGLAELSPAAVYIHYRSKEELLFAISEAAHLDVRQRVVSVSRTGAPEERLRGFVHAYSVWHAEHRLQARVAQYEMTALSAEHAESIARIRRSIERALRSIISAGINEGSFAVPTPRMATLAILSLGIDVARWYREDGPWTPHDIGVAYEDLALGLVRWARP